MGHPVRIPAAGTHAAITPEIVAVIGEAAKAIVGKPVRIVSVRVSAELPSHSNAWMDEGRHMICESHNMVQRGH